MAYPYANTLRGLIQTINQLRSNFHKTVKADTLKKWGIASNNETYVVNVLRFLGLIDDEGKQVDKHVKAFSLHEDEAFAKEFQGIVEKAYKSFFELFGDAGWTLEESKLITFFRGEDGTSAYIGKRQATTFKALAGLAGYGPLPVEAKSTPTKKASPAKKKTPKAKSEKTTSVAATALPLVESSSPILTVRIEVNLPVTDDQAVYDKIFKSLRKNLLNE